MNDWPSPNDFFNSRPRLEDALWDTLAWAFIGVATFLGCKLWRRA